MSALVEVAGLEVVASDEHGQEKVIVDDVAFSIAKGQVLALIGESGSGKTTIALSMLGYARGGCRISAGSIRIGETDVLAMNQEQLPGLRGRRVCYVAQSAAAAFNPSKPIMAQVIEAALIHNIMPRSEAETRAVELFNALALPDPQGIGKRYPHQVSGGQLQRLMAAMALITEPQLVIFDEPTTALDVTTQIDVLRVFKRVIREREITAVYVSHDLAVVTQMADQIVVLNDGRIRESGPTEQVIHRPKDAYTQTLMAAAQPTLRDTSAPAAEHTPVLEIGGLVAGYGKVDAHGRPTIPVLSDIDLSIAPGSTLGVIGESGSGKSTLARVVAGLLPPAQGSILLDGKPLPPTIAQRTREQFRQIQIVFQNADTALNPAHSVAGILGRPLHFYHDLSGKALQLRIAELLDLVQLPCSVAQRKCSNLSGGQKQRLNLARALAAEPELILCDEVTSSLDTVVGAAILDLMAQLRRELNVSYLFISHDISTVRSICDDILVLYAGEKVEYGSRRNFMKPPYHPYTDLLIDSVPKLEIGWLDQAGKGQSPPPVGTVNHASPNLCCFLDRCPVRIEGVCNKLQPPRVLLRDGNEVLCHQSDAELQLAKARGAAG